jgi:hypothetical protein
MLTLIALSAILAQQTPVPPAPPEVHTRVMVMGADGPGGLDRDGDGQITREEFAAPMNDHFARMDANGDGRLSTGELAAGPGTMGGEGHDIRIMHGPGGPGEHEIRVIGGPGGPDGPGVRHFEMRRTHPGGGAGAHAEHAGDGEARTMVFVGGPAGPGGEREIVIHGGPGGHAMMDGPHGEAGAAVSGSRSVAWAVPAATTTWTPTMTARSARRSSVRPCAKPSPGWTPITRASSRPANAVPAAARCSSIGSRRAPAKGTDPPSTS